MKRELFWLLILPICGCRSSESPWLEHSWLDHSCPFQPSCCGYAFEALKTHGRLLGLWLTLRRCNLWGGSGSDLILATVIRKTAK